VSRRLVGTIVALCATHFACAALLGAANDDELRFSAADAGARSDEDAPAMSEAGGDATADRAEAGVCSVDTCELVATDDTYIRSWVQDRAHTYADQEGVAVTVDDVGQRSVGLFHFDLTGLPPKLEVFAAKIIVHTSVGQGQGGDMNVLAILSPWDSQTASWIVPWPDGPPYGPLLGVVYSNPPLEQRSTLEGDLDPTQVTSWLAGGDAKNGLALVMAGTLTRQVYVASVENRDWADPAVRLRLRYR